MTEEEMRAYTAPHWRIRSPKFDEADCLNNPKTRCWEAVLCLSTPKSASWVKERFPRCEVSPLFVSDMRQGQARVASFQSRRSKVRGKKSYTPTDDEISAS